MCVNKEYKVWLKALQEMKYLFQKSNSYRMIKNYTKNSGTSQLKAQQANENFMLTVIVLKCNIINLLYLKPF